MGFIDRQDKDWLKHSQSLWFFILISNLLIRLLTCYWICVNDCKEMCTNASHWMIAWLSFMYISSANMSSTILAFTYQAWPALRNNVWLKAPSELLFLSHLNYIAGFSLGTLLCLWITKTYQFTTNVIYNNTDRCLGEEQNQYAPGSPHYQHHLQEGGERWSRKEERKDSKGNEIKG